MTQTVPSGLQEAVEKGLRVHGEVTFDTRTDYGFNRSTTYHQWKLGLSLENRTGLPIELGRDLFLYESNDDGSAFNGVAVIARKPETTGPSTYGFDYTYETLNTKFMRTDNSITISMSGAQDKLPDLAPLPSGQNRAFRWTLEQMTWLRDEMRARLVLVLPELRLNADGRLLRYRLVAYYPKPSRGTKWAAGKQTVIPLRTDRLDQILGDPESNRISKLLAVNWLAETDPRAAVPALVAAASPLSEGQLLASCLEILTSLKGDGLGAHAVNLLSNKELPNGIRSRAAQYVGAVRYAGGLAALIELASDQDDAVANGAIVGLGSFGNPKSVEALTGLLSDTRQNKRHPLIAKSLARTKSPKAVQTLKELARRNNKDALEALVSAGSPDTFDFFVELSQRTQPKEVFDVVVRGLRAAGGERAIPPLLAMLEKDNPPDAQNPTQTDTLVDQLAALNGKEDSPDFSFLSSEPRTDAPLQFAPGKVTSQLVQLARTGNLRAMQALARSNDDTVRVPLQDLARAARGTGLQVVLEGLSRRWAGDSVDLFARGLEEPDTGVVRVAIQGLVASKDPRAPGLLAPLLRHPERDLRQTVAYSLTNMKLPEAALPIVADAAVVDSNDAIISILAEILIKANWRDAAAIKPLGKKLRAASGPHQHGYVKLLRHLSLNAMGPSDDNEYYRDQKGWAGKWVSWANIH